MREPLTRALGSLFGALGDVALSSWPAYRTLFSPLLPPGLRRWVARQRAEASYLSARRTVPVYDAFVREHTGRRRPRRLEDVPPMSKDSYIRRFGLAATCRGGQLPGRGVVIDESSGTSGTPTDWARGPAEREALRRLLGYTARATFGPRGFVLLNAFALGPWATGMSVSMALVDGCILKSVGPDIAKIVGAMRRLGPDHRYVVAGYPPFLKALVDQADLDWSRYEVFAVVGGEGMSEALRSRLNRCFRKTISSFGASDLEINLAVETDFSIALRQRLADSPGLAHDLTGQRGAPPMIFQYDPLNCWIESDDRGELLFTLNRTENLSPRIRYQLGDAGSVRTFDHVARVLADHGLRPADLAPLRHRAALPLLFHHGRREHAVAYYGSKVTPHDLQQALLGVPALAARIGEFALHPFEDDQANKRLEFWIELAPGTPDLSGATAALGEAVLASLALINQDFRESLRLAPAAARPVVRVFSPGTSPMASQDHRVKKSYIL